MHASRILRSALCVGLIALAGCDRAGDAQKREEAINSGTASAPTGERQCQLLRGKWLGDTGGCKIKQQSCAAIGGNWDKDAGCIVATAEPDGCAASSGLAAVDGHCVVAQLSATALDTAWTCHVAQGKWLADTQRCGMTAHLCAQASGTWQADTVCELPVAADAAQCSGVSGMRVLNGRCVMLDLSRQDLEQMGSEDIERARSRLNR